MTYHVVHGLLSEMIGIFDSRVMFHMTSYIFFFQAEDGIRDLVRSRGLGDVYKRQGKMRVRVGKTDTVYQITGGFVEVLHNNVSVLVEGAKEI